MKRRHGQSNGLGKGNTLKGYEQGKVAFVKAEAKDVLLIMMQHGNNFNRKRQGCIFEN